MKKSLLLLLAIPFMLTGCTKKQDQGAKKLTEEEFNTGLQFGSSEYYQAEMRVDYGGSYGYISRSQKRDHENYVRVKDDNGVKETMYFDNFQGGRYYYTEKNDVWSRHSDNLTLYLDIPNEILNNAKAIRYEELTWENGKFVSPEVTTLLGTKYKDVSYEFVNKRISKITYEYVAGGTSGLRGGPSVNAKHTFTFTYNQEKVTIPQVD